MDLDKVFDIAIIGAGPGGMACAIEAKLAGIDNIVVVDKAETHNYMIHKFYKKGKRVDRDWMGIKFDFVGNVTFDECSKRRVHQANGRLTCQPRCARQICLQHGSGIC